jgi:hypothetical protein
LNVPGLRPITGVNTVQDRHSRGFRASITMAMGFKALWIQKNHPFWTSRRSLMVVILISHRMTRKLTTLVPEASLVPLLRISEVVSFKHMFIHLLEKRVR